MCGAKSPERIDKLLIEPVSDDLESLDRRCEILDSSCILPVVVLHDREVVQRPGGFVRLRSVEPDGHLDHAFGRNISFVEIALFQQLPEPGKFTQHLVFGYLLLARVYGLGGYLFFRNRDGLIERARKIIRALLLLAIGGHR